MQNKFKEFLKIVTAPVIKNHRKKKNIVFLRNKLTCLLQGCGGDSEGSSIFFGIKLIPIPKNEKKKTNFIRGNNLIEPYN